MEYNKYDVIAHSFFCRTPKIRRQNKNWFPITLFIQTNFLFSFLSFSFRLSISYFFSFYHHRVSLFYFYLTRENGIPIDEDTTWFSYQLIEWIYHSIKLTHTLFPIIIISFLFLYEDEDEDEEERTIIASYQ